MQPPPPHKKNKKNKKYYTWKIDSTILTVKILEHLAINTTFFAWTESNKPFYLLFFHIHPQEAKTTTQKRKHKVLYLLLSKICKQQNHNFYDLYAVTKILASHSPCSARLRWAVNDVVIDKEWKRGVIHYLISDGINILRCCFTNRNHYFLPCFLIWVALSLM